MNRASIIGFAIACGACKKSAPDCEATLGAAFDRVAKTQFKETLADHRRRFDAYASSLRGRIIKTCKSDEWSAETIECFASSKKPSEVQSCGSSFSAKQLDQLRFDVAQAVKPSVSLDVNQSALDDFGLAQDELREATRQLVATGLPSDPRRSTADEDMTRARESIMSEKGVPLATFEAAVLLAIQYRLETALPARTLARRSR